MDIKNDLQKLIDKRQEVQTSIDKLEAKIEIAEKEFEEYKNDIVKTFETDDIEALKQIRTDLITEAESLIGQNDNDDLDDFE